MVAELFSLKVNAQLQSIVDLSSSAANISEVSIKYKRIGTKNSDAGGSATYDVDFRADTTHGEMTFHGAYTPSEWLDENRTFSVLTLQDSLGEDNENIKCKE